LGGVFTTHPPEGERLLIVTPVVFLLAGIYLKRVWEEIKAIFQHIPGVTISLEWFLIPSIICVLAGTFIINYHDYFVVFGSNGFDLPYNLGRQIVDDPPLNHIYLMGNLSIDPMNLKFRFITKARPVTQIPGIGDFPRITNDGKGITVLMAPDSSLLKLIKIHFPNGTTSEYKDNKGLVVFVIYRVLPGNLPLITIPNSPDSKLLYELYNNKLTGTKWDAAGNFLFTEKGFDIILDGLLHLNYVEIALENINAYRLEFRKTDQLIYTADIPARPDYTPGLRIESVYLPENIVKTGFDDIKVIPVSAGGNYGLGYFHLLDSDGMEGPNHDISDLREPKTQNSGWDVPGNVVMSEKGVRINLGQTSHAPQVETSMDGNDTYRFRFINNHQIIYVSDSPKPANPGPGLRVETISIPKNIQMLGYDQIDVLPLEGDGAYSIGHLRLMDTP